MRRNPSVLLEQAAPLLFRLMLFGALWLWLRGHNAPGGGFVGALTALSATAVYALVFGTERAAAALPLTPPRLAALGVSIAAVSGLPGLITGLPFLTHLWWKLPLGIATTPVSTVMLFDLGVLLCVWGALAGFCLRLLEDG